MDYKNAKEVLPADLLRAVQKYADGTLLYIPQKKKRTGWGIKNGARMEFRARNREIVREYLSGKTVCELAEKYCLSTETMRKIICNTLKL